VRVGDGVKILPFPRDHKDVDNGLYVIRDGIVVIAKDTEIPPGMRIGPDP